jgi:CRP/FNR family cyclic AMP-dependent transcriptional regulator
MATEGDEPSGGGWFAQLPAAERAALHAEGAAHHYRTGATLFHEGDPSDWVLLVTRGRVKVASVTADGRDVVLAVRGPGELVGELSALDGLPRSAAATALDEVDARVVTADRFRAFLAAHPQASLGLLCAVCGRLRDADRRRVEFVALDATGRVARRLAELAGQFGVPGANGSLRIDVPITQEDLAGWTGSSREAIGKALSALRARGGVATSRRSITVLDLERLRSRGT